MQCIIVDSSASIRLAQGPDRRQVVHQRGARVSMASGLRRKRCILKPKQFPLPDRVVVTSSPPPYPRPDLTVAARIPHSLLSISSTTVRVPRHPRSPIRPRRCQSPENKTHDPHPVELSILNLVGKHLINANPSQYSPPHHSFIRLPFPVEKVPGANFVIRSLLLYNQRPGRHARSHSRAPPAEAQNKTPTPPQPLTPAEQSQSYNTPPPNHRAQFPSRALRRRP